MTIEEFKSSLDTEMLDKVKDVCAKDKDVNEADAKVLYDFIIGVASPSLGEDNVGEPFRYLCSSTNGVRIDDLKAVIGEDFDPEIWTEFCTGLGFDLFVKRNLTPDCEVTDFRFPPIRVSLQKLMGEGAYRACASDLGYHLLEHRQAGDPVRDLQTMHLLLDGDEAAAAAEYISQAEGESLRLAVMTMGNALKDGPEYVQQCVFDLPLVQSEKVDQKKILMLQLNDCIAIVGNPDRQKIVAEKLHNIIGSMIQLGNNEITVLLGIAKLRIAQSARTHAQIAHQQQKEDEAKQYEQQAQQTFIGALNYLMPPLQQADPTTISDEQVRQYWLCLKICQEMAQPKAISLLFEAIVKVEQAQIAALANKHADTSEASEEAEADEKRAHQLSTSIIDQHIDMSKLYYQMPQPLQEQFTNYSEGCISLIQAYLDSLNKEGEDNEKEQGEELRLCNFYQTLGELYDHLGKTDESYDAYTEAQIRQMRYLAALKKEDEEAGIQMSQRSLIARLTLSVTNHNLGLYYRKEGKSQRDLSVLLRSNMDIALDCFKAYPRDGRVIHFVINAALELGDLQHKSKGLKAECDTYTRVISQFGVLNNLRLDQQLCVDMAMIHTKCGQCQADDNIRRYSDALRNLDVAQKLWSSLAQNTKNPEFQKNAEAVAKMMKQIRK
ncbi:MAG: hypothetical protein J6Y05_06820 [Bacteroidales bacterium]|nr:hypothetical protein [Bacteroidales bacterium]